MSNMTEENNVEKQIQRLVNTRWNRKIIYEQLGELTFNEIESSVRRKVNLLADRPESIRFDSSYKHYRMALELIEIANKELGVPES